MNTLYAIIVAMLVLVGGVSGCQGPLVRTDLDTYVKNPQEFKGKMVLFTTDITHLLDNQETYLRKKVELAGYVEYLDHHGVSDWGFRLKDDAGNSVLCHEQNYRVAAWDRLVTILRRAERERGVVTVVGEAEWGGKIELDWIEYQGQHLDTDYKPYSIALPW